MSSDISSMRRLIVLSERGILSISFAASGPSITSTSFLQAGNMSDSAKVCGFLDLASNLATKKTSLLCLLTHTHSRKHTFALCGILCFKPFEIFNIFVLVCRVLGVQVRCHLARHHGCISQRLPADQAYWCGARYLATSSEPILKVRVVITPPFSLC